MTVVMVVAASLCARTARSDARPRRPVPVSTVVLRDPVLTEVSGCAVSRRNAGIIWVHNDSGDGPRLYAVDIVSGSIRATFTVPGIEAVDWEDVALAPNGEIVIGDIGDNKRERDNILVHSIAEPPITDGVIVANTAAPNTRRLSYPDRPHDAEALVVTPDGVVEIITKDDGTLYRAPKGNGDAVLERVGPVLHGGITGADTLADGSGVLVRDYLTMSLLRRPAKQPFDAAWSARPVTVPGPFLVQAEAICGDALSRFAYTTAERRGAPSAPLVRVGIP